MIPLIRSGTVCGVVTGFASLGNFLVPLVKDWVVADDRSVTDWRNLYLGRKLLSCSQVKSWVKELISHLIGSLFSGSQSEARLAL